MKGFQLYAILELALEMDKKSTVDYGDQGISLVGHFNPDLVEDVNNKMRNLGIKFDNKHPRNIITIEEL